MKHGGGGFTLALKPRADVTRRLEVSVAPHQGLTSSKNLDLFEKRRQICSRIESGSLA